MTKQEIIMKLLISLNQGNSGYIVDRVQYATEQYEKLVKKGIIKENIEDEKCNEQT
jgi:hypothetical protein